MILLSHCVKFNHRILHIIQCQPVTGSILDSVLCTLCISMYFLLLLSCDIVDISELENTFNSTGIWQTTVSRLTGFRSYHRPQLCTFGRKKSVLLTTLKKKTRTIWEMYSLLGEVLIITSVPFTCLDLPEQQRTETCHHPHYTVASFQDKGT